MGWRSLLLFDVVSSRCGSLFFLFAPPIYFLLSFSRHEFLQAPPLWLTTHDAKFLWPIKTANGLFQLIRHWGRGKQLAGKKRLHWVLPGNSHCVARCGVCDIFCNFIHVNPPQLQTCSTHPRQLFPTQCRALMIREFTTATALEAARHTEMKTH